MGDIMYVKLIAKVHSEPIAKIVNSLACIAVDILNIYQRQV